MVDFKTLITWLIEFCVSFGGKMFAALLVTAIGLKLGKILLNMMMKSRGFRAIDVTAQTFLRSALNIAIKIVVFITAIGILGVPLTSVVTVVASCGVAIGLALQGGLSNLAGGIIILMFKPFEVGDYIDDGSVNGTVEAIGIFHTTLVTPDNKHVIIPNGGLMNSTITASNQLSTRRIDWTFSVSYSSDIDKVKKVIVDTVMENDKVMKDKGVDVFLSKHTESGIEFSLRVWSKTEDYWTIYFDINEKMKKAFDREGIEIPYPQMDVHVK